ncbi:MAG: DUF1573 domain-containing protein [Muribaculaceae bacterium]|nr:DUF1573 domain-containing protein [Muribaculaceae bacterium]
MNTNIGKNAASSIRRILPYVLTAFGLLTVASCGDSKRKAYEKAVVEWTGKRILFPDSMRLVGGEIITKPEADFTIVSYYDSIGCSECRMKLQFWNEFMQRVDSVRGDKTVNLMMIAASVFEKDLERIQKYDDFKYNIIYDPKDHINSLNLFPVDDSMRTFLIDKNNKVLTFGNPIQNKRLFNLYLSIIGKSENNIENDREWIEYSYDFGNVKSGESVSHTFSMKNESSDTLRVREVISSCECTEGTVIPTIIPPGSPYRVEVSFRETIPDSFLRSVMVYFENQTSPLLRFEVTGQVTTN